MQANDSEMDILIISNDRHRSGLLRQSIEQRGVKCSMRLIEPNLGAFSFLRRAGQSDHANTPDLILFDLSDAEPDKLRLLKRIAFGQRRTETPVVILTSDHSEARLYNAGIADSRAVMFEPTELACFLNKMREHRRPRFKRALGVMYELGPILVRLPVAFIDGPDTMLA